MLASLPHSDNDIIVKIHVFHKSASRKMSKMHPKRPQLPSQLITKWTLDKPTPDVQACFKVLPQ